MHHIAEILNLHILGHLDRTIFSNLTNIITSQVNQHTVFRSFFDIMWEFICQSSIFSLIGTTRASSSNRIGYNLSIFYWNQALGASTNHLIISKIIEIKVVWWVGHTQVTVVIQRISLKVRWKALAKHTLEHISLTNEFLGLSHHIHEDFFFDMIWKLQGLQGLRCKLIWRLSL